MSLSAILPQPKHRENDSDAGNGERDDDDDEEESMAGQILARKTGPPPYGHRSAFLPKQPSDYGDGGAFPEIHIAQFPLDMGRKKSAGSNALAVQVDNEGKVKYDAIARQGHDGNRIIQSSQNDLIPLQQRAGAGQVDLSRPSAEEAAETMQRTKATLEGIVSGKLAAQQPKNVMNSNRKEPTYVRYTPANQMGEGSDVVHKQRIIKMVDMQEDPMEPPKFKHKKIPARPPSPPPPVLRSPPRKLSAQERADWVIPPSISNWKNPKGYTIPLDKRLAADGRSIRDVQISDRFAQFSEALNIAERTARDEIRQRNLLQQRLAEKEKASKEEHLRELAQKAREERAGYGRSSSRHSPSPTPLRAPSVSRGRSMSHSPHRKMRSRSRSARGRRRARSWSSSEEDDAAAARQREELRRERRRENEREMRMSKMGTEGRMKLAAREQNRDISEKIALGIAKPAKASDTFDQRLFNQSSGLRTSINEDNPYDKPLFSAQEAASRIYKPSLSRYDGDEDEAAGEMDRLEKESRFDVLGGTARGLGGSENAPARDGPVEFVKDATGNPSEVDRFLDDVQRGLKREPDQESPIERPKRSKWE